MKRKKMVLRVMVGGMALACAVGSLHAQQVSRVVLHDGTNWLIRRRLTSGTADYTVTWGQSGDKFVMADFNGDGSDDLGIVRPSGSVLRWYLSKTWKTYDPVRTTFDHGALSDVPLVGDWNNDGVATPGLVRPRGAPNNFRSTSSCRPVGPETR